ncbi:MAG: CAP domain-containing protein [Planctomycetota bacterium]|jgi:uncharacterized protein YkwD
MRRCTLFIGLVVVLSMACFAVSCSKKGDDKISTSTGTSPTVPTGTGTGPTGTGTTPPGPGPGGTLGELYDAINADRVAYGLGTFTYNNSLAAVAQAYADWMKAGSKTSYSANADGKSPDQRITEGGITFITAGEAGCNGSSYSTWTAAYNRMKATHGSTLSNPAFNEVGLGYAQILCSS